MTTGFGELSFDPVFILGELEELYKVSSGLRVFRGSSLAALNLFCINFSGF